MAKATVDFTLEPMASALTLEPNFERQAIQLRYTHGIPGKYQAARDPVVAAALEIIHQHGLYDMESGDVEEWGHSALIDRWIMRTDPLGFVTYDEFNFRREAHTAFVDEVLTP